MNFAMALVHDETLEIAAVMRSDVPFDGHGIFAADHHLIHVGAFADEQAADGRPWTEWLRQSMMVLPDGSVHVDFGGPRILDRACTMDAIAAAARAGRGVHAHVEAWLRTILSSDHCDALGLRRSIPVSIIKALDRVRVNRLKVAQPGTWGERAIDSRREVLERIAQRRIDARLKSHYQAHLERQARGKA